jgi:tetratricopeptide (TPR) repeat protein
MTQSHGGLTRSRRISVAALTAVSVAILLSACGGKSALELRRLGVDAYNDANYAEAALYLEDAMRRDQKDEIAHKYMALTNERLKQFPQARKQYQWLLKNAETDSSRKEAGESIERLRSICSGAPRPRIVLLSTDCDHSKSFDPLFMKVCTDYKGKFDVQVLDVQKAENKDLMDSYVQYLNDRFADSWTVPMCMYQCKHGVIKTAEMGAKTEAELRDSIKQFMAELDKEVEPG